MEPRKVTLSVEVAGRAPAGCRQVEVDLYLPVDLNPLSGLWCCVPGGGVSRSYFDLDVPSQFGDYSMARVVAASGAPVLLIDPPGAGGSDLPDDGYQLTPRSVAEVLHVVVTEVKSRLSRGDVEGFPTRDLPRTIGLGHSAGALLVACQQAHHRTFDALALLGYSDSGLEEFLTEEEKSMIGRPHDLMEALPGLVRARFADPLPARPYVDIDGPRSGTPATGVKEAEHRAATQLLALVGLMAIIPGSMKAELDQIDVPTFAAVGEHDIAGDIALLAAQLPACPDLTLVTLPGVGHNHNLSDSRLVLWDRLLRWGASLAPSGSLDP